MGLELLAQTRIQKIVAALEDIRQLPQELLWYNRVPKVPATDNEILARVTVGQVVSADIIMDDAKAVVRGTTPITFHQTKIPNIKHGRNINQDMMSLLLRISSNPGLPSTGGFNGVTDYDTFDSYLITQMERLRRGVLQQAEAMTVAMLCDSFDYDRLGVKISGLTWGMPSDLKVTPSVPWSTAASATPVTDVQLVQQIAQEKYGILFDRMTLSRTDFNYMVGTTEFRNKAALYSQFVLPTAGTFPVEDTATMKILAGRMLNMVVEIYDAQTWVENTYGQRNAVRYQPLGKVLLTNSSFDNDSAVWDFANAIVLETLAGSLTGEGTGAIGGFAGPQTGPVGYATVPDDLNPPNITLWNVMRGFPRKHELAANACLTVTA